MLKNLLTVAMIGAVTVASMLAGCKKEDPAASSTTPGGGAAASEGGKRKIVIGMVAKSQSNDVFQAAYTGAKNAARDLGSKYNADVTIDWRTPAAEDAAKQVEAVEALTRAGADAVLVACTD